jgi:hypothetical protein
MPVVGATCSPSGLTVSVADRDWVPWPLSVLVNVMVAVLVPARLFASPFTENVTDPAEAVLPMVAEAGRKRQTRRQWH